MVEFLATALRHTIEFASNGEYLKYALEGFFLASLPGVLVAAVACVLLYSKTTRLPLAGLLGAALAWSVSGGRHFHILPIRIAFLLLLSAGAMLAVLFAAKVPRRMGAMALVLMSMVALWCDIHVLPNLYVGFHVACVCLLVGAAVLLRCPSRAAWQRSGRLEFDVLVLIAATLLSASGAILLRRADNVRRIAIEHGVLARYAVQGAGALGLFGHDEDSAAETPPTTSATAVGTPPDWSGKDILLFTVDALRADHLGAYGYGRPTTPNFDALAARGMRFNHAYCPTPHTSYSVTSLMTGKYMHPLLSLGLGAESHDGRLAPKL